MHRNRLLAVQLGKRFPLRTFANLLPVGFIFMLSSPLVSASAGCLAEGTQVT